MKALRRHRGSSWVASWLLHGAPEVPATSAAQQRALEACIPPTRLCRACRTGMPHTMAPPSQSRESWAGRTVWHPALTPDAKPVSNLPVRMYGPITKSIRRCKM